MSMQFATEKVSCLDVATKEVVCIDHGTLVRRLLVMII